MKFSRFPQVVGLSLPVLFISPVVLAEEVATDLAEVMVTADRTARSVDDTLASVSIVTRRFGRYLFSQSVGLGLGD